MIFRAAVAFSLAVGTAGFTPSARLATTRFTPVPAATVAMNLEDSFEMNLMPELEEMPEGFEL